MWFSKSIFALCVALMATHSAAHEAPPTGIHAAKTQKTLQKPLMPARKSGLWEVTVGSNDLTLQRAGQAPQRPLTVQQCTSAETEQVMLTSIMPGQEDCHELRVRRLAKGVGFEISAVCYVHDNRLNAQMELRGDLQSRYHGTFEVKYPQTPMHNTGRMTFKGRWLGMCATNQRPGDMVLPNGVTVNVVDDRKRAQNNSHEGHKH